MSGAPPYVIETSKRYDRSLKRFLTKHPEMEQRVRTIIRTLKADPFTPSLRLHGLSGDLAGLSAVRMNYTYRITMTIDADRRTIMLEDIGSHGEVYGSGDDD